MPTLVVESVPIKENVLHLMLTQKLVFQFDYERRPFDMNFSCKNFSDLVHQLFN